MQPTRRTRPQPAATPAPAARLIRRPTVAAARAIKPSTRDFYAEVVAELQAIANLETQQDILTRERGLVEDRILKIMQEGKLEAVDDGTFAAAYKSTMGKSTTKIDLAKFRKYVGDEKFMSVISIGVTDAKALVAEKEQPKAGFTVTAGTQGPAKLTISRKKKK